MPELLKNMYNRESLYEVAVAIQSVYNSFKVDEFIKSTMDETWNNLELKARCRKISMNLVMYLPEDYKEALSILEKSVTGFYFAFFFPDFVEVYGQDDINWDLSISALERNTEYWSSEFAVRAFIIKDEERMMAQMRKWSKHKSEHVRRLASEGCRPQLPWGQAISKFKKDPTPVLPILEQLKTDTSTYVQKSVANNLNDISKTHPDLVISIAKDWYGKNKSTNWIVKHGCRTLLKKGNRDVLALFGYDDTTSINFQDFTLETTSISIGEDLTFSFNILAKKATKTRLEYGIDYMKSNGKRNRKIFKISEVSLKENEKKSYMKKHSFADVSVRKHYPGIHSIAIIINGIEKDKLDFELGI
ncbi:DNA alkylation repair protein [Clostridioides difficile]|uniref:DNA alkylation repair protein n=1 Tax=Clostridioides difficile TaxID=1496 RepID=UPI0010B4109B|nr:DNA alkylation repair protein [Clostridioides difficile]VHX78331.1 DNA alkylation repair protein [Clostridioides difficile]